MRLIDRASLDAAKAEREVREIERAINRPIRIWRVKRVLWRATRWLGWHAPEILIVLGVVVIVAAVAAAMVLAGGGR